MVKAKVVKNNSWCGCWGYNKGFPTFAIIILVLGVLLLLSETGILKTKIPWFPAIIIIISIGWIINHYRK